MPHQFIPMLGIDAGYRKSGSNILFDDDNPLQHVGGPGASRADLEHVMKKLLALAAGLAMFWASTTVVVAGTCRTTCSTFYGQTTCTTNCY